MFWIYADNSNDTFAFYHLALIAHHLYRRAHFHWFFSQVYSTL